jgi:hypothetical protein
MVVASAMDLVATNIFGVHHYWSGLLSCCTGTASSPSWHDRTSQARRHSGDNQQKVSLASMGREQHARRAHRYQATD